MVARNHGHGAMQIERDPVMVQKTSTQRFQRSAGHAGIRSIRTPRQRGCTARTFHEIEPRVERPRGFQSGWQSEVPCVGPVDPGQIRARAARNDGDAGYLALLLSR